MMAGLKSGLIALLTSIVWLGCQPAHAQTARAVTFDGETYVRTPLILDRAPISSSAFACSYWYLSSQQLIGTGSIVSLFPAYVGGSNQLGFQVQHYWAGGNTMQLLLFVQDSTGTKKMLATSADALPYDNAWHNVTVTADTSLGKSLYAIDGIVGGWATNTIQGVPFTYLSYGSTYVVGADLSPALQGQDFYAGNLSELFCHQGDNALIYMTTPGSSYRPTVLKTVENGQVTGFGPLNLGAQCTWPYGLTGEAYPPTLCMRGNSAAFLYNAWGTNFLVPQGTLTDASTSPWDLWQ